MTVEGGCYCGKIRYESAGEPLMKVQCHCRPCQYFSGGAANMAMLMPLAGFRYTTGAVKAFRRDDLERAVTREFCGDCGVQILTRSPHVPAVILKVGTLDDPSRFGKAQIAIHTSEKQAFHCIEEGIKTFPGLPPR